LIKKLSKKIQVLLVGAKGEEFFFNDFKPFSNNTISLVGKNSIIEQSTIVKNARAVVCTDSALGHIAAAVNTPVFVLIVVEDAPCKTSLNKVFLIRVNLPCSPCYKTFVMKACQDNIYMKSISTQMVLDALSLANIT